MFPMRHPFPASVGLIVASVLVAGCGPLMSLISTPTPTPSPTPTPGVGVPARSDQWELTITSASTTEEWFTHKPNVTTKLFLILDITIRNLDAAQETQIDTTELTVTTASKGVVPPVGFEAGEGSHIDYMIGDDGKKIDFGSSVFKGFTCLCNPTVGSNGDLIAIKLIYAPFKIALDEPLTMKFGDHLETPFTVP